MTQKEIEALLEEKMQALYRDSDVYFGFSKNKKQANEEASLDEGISIGMLRGAVAIRDILSKLRGEL